MLGINKEGVACIQHLLRARGHVMPRNTRKGPWEGLHMPSHLSFFNSPHITQAQCPSLHPTDEEAKAAQSLRLDLVETRPRPLGWKCPGWTRVALFVPSPSSLHPGVWQWYPPDVHQHRGCN